EAGRKTDALARSANENVPSARAGTASRFGCPMTRRYNRTHVEAAAGSYRKRAGARLRSKVKSRRNGLERKGHTDGAESREVYSFPGTAAGGSRLRRGADGGAAVLGPGREGPGRPAPLRHRRVAAGDAD